MFNIKKVAAAVTVALCAVPSFAAIVSNGSFESATGVASRVTTNVTDWSSVAEFAFVANSTTLGLGNNTSWGNFGAIDLLAATTSPDGGNFIAIDADFLNNGALSTTLSGLTVGESYTLSFYQAVAKQSVAGNSGAVWSDWQVSVGGNVIGTSTQQTASTSNGFFSGWLLQTMTFQATAASETLSFLAQGGPTGLPPFVLLDGVSVTANVVPEPAMLALVGLGLAGIGLSRRKRA